VRDEDILMVDPFVGIGKHHHFGLDDPITMTMYNQLWIPIPDVKASVVSNGWEMRPNVIPLHPTRQNCPVFHPLNLRP
jgi:hypothetical protein